MNQTIDCKDELALSGDAVVEVVPPADGVVENRVVLMCVVSIIVIASSLLFWLYPAQKEQEVIIPEGLHAHLTSLSIAADEISMMMELDMGVPTLSELSDLEIAPFAQNAIASLPNVSWAQANHCFIGNTQISNTDYQIRLIFDENNSASTDWRISDALSVDELCSPQNMTLWRDSNAINPNHLHSH
ncbi:DUF6162 family protein [Vibrio sp. nBUS_14]|jgi:hypothetical protein|uniref:DUF6162 family protein n=1 Tax=unclassified Vibrio TaxID=2614977 RepID=UPI003EBCED67